MGESVERDGAAVRVPPPLVYLGALILGVALQGVVVALPLGLPRGVRVAGGAVLGALGIGLVGAALGLFRRSGQDPEPWKPTPAIVSHGVYRHTRNPMYVGMAAILAGFGVGLGNGWLLLLVPVVLAIVYATAIRHEEAYLSRKFGAVYDDYRRSVRRWL